MEATVGGCSNFQLTLWTNSNFSDPTNSLCDYVISGTAYGSMGTIYSGTQTIANNDHVHNFNLSAVLQQGECVTGFTVDGYSTIDCQCPVNLVLPNVTPQTPTPTNTPTLTSTSTPTLTATNTPTLTSTPTLT